MARQRTNEGPRLNVFQVLFSFMNTTFRRKRLSLVLGRNVAPPSRWRGGLVGGTLFFAC